MADTEKNPLSITETIAEYSGTGNMSGSQYYEEIMKDSIAFLEERRKKDYGEKKQEILPPSAK